MTSRCVLMLLCQLVVVGTVLASPILEFDGPESFTPGSDFQLTVSLENVESLSLYNIQLFVESTSGIGGIDYFFLEAIQPVSQYVFQGLSSDGFAYSILDDCGCNITLSDLVIPGSVDTTTGVNDLIATVVIRTHETVGDEITISVIPESLELDKPSTCCSSCCSIDGFDELLDNLPAFTISVPEPAGMMFLLLGAVMPFRRNRL